MIYVCCHVLSCVVIYCLVRVSNEATSICSEDRTKEYIFLLVPVGFSWASVSESLMES